MLERFIPQNPGHSVPRLFGSIVDTQMTMIRGLVDRIPNMLLNIVLGWSCLLFFGYGLLSTFDAVTVLLAALGATAVASAVFLILELSDPYSTRAC